MNTDSVKASFFTARLNLGNRRRCVMNSTESRVAKTAEPLGSHARHALMLQFVTFHLNEQKYAIDILKVQEINNLKDITPIPNAPHYVAGAINLRGKVIPILNLRRRFNMREQALTEITKIIIIDVRGIVMGMIVDAISDVLRIPPDVVESAPPISSPGVRKEFIVGIAKLTDELVIILDIDQLFEYGGQATLAPD